MGISTTRHSGADKLEDRAGRVRHNRAGLGSVILLILAALMPVARAVPPGTPSIALVVTNLAPDPYCGTETGRVIRVQTPGTRRMIDRLQRILMRSPPEQNLFLNAQRVEYYRKQVSQAPNIGEGQQLRLQMAVEMLRAGQSEEALKEFEAVEQWARRSNALGTKGRAQVQMLRALCHLRIGEQENCLSNHTSQSCLFPLEPGGFHVQQRGSRAAVQVLTNYLASNPKDLRARWLLNIACMTLGEYPGQVPSPWLIDPKCFASDYDIKRFPDVAGQLGLDVDDLAGGVVADDFDGDGFLDLLVSTWGLAGQLRYFRNNGDGTFTERTKEAGLWGITGGLNLVHTDYNNDGHLDVLMLRGAWQGKAGHHPNSLLRNNGDGTFDDVTEEAGLLSFHPTQTATWFDYDNDGWLDLFIGNESTPDDPSPCELFHNNGNGTFTECAAALGVAIKGFVKGVTSGDYNNDGRMDLYLSLRGQRNILLRNDGPLPTAKGGVPGWKFTDATAFAGVGEPIYSFPTWFWDYDNDGWLDILVTGYGFRDVGDVAADYLGLPHSAELPRLYHNNHDGTFTDVTAQTHLNKLLHAMGASYGDLDNDGFLDFYLATGDPDLGTLIPNRMFRNEGGKYFQDVTTSGGFGHLQKGHAVAFADLDNDGDQDVYVVMGGAYSGDNYRNSLFLNPGHGNHWLKLKLEGVRSNRAAIGARIRVIVETAEGPRSIYKTVATGGSFGTSPLRQEIGLGQATAIQKVEIFWPATGQTQVLSGLALDQCYHVREGDAAATLMPLKKIVFDVNGPPHHHGVHVMSQGLMNK